MSRFVPALVLALALGCTRTTEIGSMEPDAGPPGLFALTGQLCTGYPDPNGFPVKVILLVDQSASNCITDPPGSAFRPTICEQWTSATGYPIGAQPQRVRALTELATQLEARPNTQVMLVPFALNVMNVWPSTGRFARPDPSLFARLQGLQSELGLTTLERTLTGASDFQGALSFAVSAIEADVASTNQQAPGLTARTRYAVVLLTDGPPSPRCTYNDNLTTYASAQNPHGVWADTGGDFCNLIDPQDPDSIVGFVAGTDRNQDAQLASLVEHLRRIEREEHVGAVRFSARFWTNEQALNDCGVLCNELWGFQRTNAGAYVEARTLLQDLATRGGGSYAEYADAPGLATLNFTGVQLQSFAARNVKKSFIAQPANATRVQGVWVSDLDGDGLPDSLEAEQSTDPRQADTDGDGFDDKYEREHRADGFDPLVKDGRGCDPLSPSTLACVVRDTDGDGLSQWQEAWLGTSPVLADTDRDGLPDGLEVKFGLDPVLAHDPATDRDADGVSDFDEVLRSTDPFFADAAARPVTVTTTERPAQNDGRVCYDFTVSGLPMLDTPARTVAASPGVNRFTVWFAESPELLSGDVGEWRAACVYARRDVTQTPPVLLPASLDFTLFEADFGPPEDLGATSCANQAAAAP
jgi:hypothetical protein